MQTLTAEQFASLLKATPMKPRFRRDLVYVASTQALEGDWSEREVLAIWNKSKRGGILLFQPNDTLYLLPFEMGRAVQSSDGRTKPVICDLCFTWHGGGGGAYITFYPNPKSDNSRAILCCNDLLCSEHVRGKTLAAAKSRAQLPEALTNDQRIARLKRNITGLIQRLALPPASS